MKQDQIDKTLKWGIVFSVVWLDGLGSLAAFIIGVKTRNRIKASGGILTGTGRALWCLIVGVPWARNLGPNDSCRNH